MRKYTVFKKLGRWHLVSGPRKGGIWLWSYETWRGAIHALTTGAVWNDG